MEKENLNMKEFKYVITDAQGIHARPAMQLVNMTKKFQSDIKLSYNGNSANAKNIVSVLMLHANQGAEVVFLINGPDEEEAYKQLRKFCKTNL
jgi:phosphocarrier protein